MTKKSRQRFRYLENEKSFEDIYKSFFHQAFIVANKIICLEGENPTLVKNIMCDGFCYDSLQICSEHVP